MATFETAKTYYEEVNTMFECIYIVKKTDKSIWYQKCGINNTATEDDLIKLSKNIHQSAAGIFRAKLRNDGIGNEYFYDYNTNCINIKYLNKIGD
jgi:hypothetical protein